MLKSGNLRAEKIKYKDGIGCCVWYPMGEDEDEMGLCFDFEYEDIDAFIEILHKIKWVKPKVYEEK